MMRSDADDFTDKFVEVGRLNYTWGRQDVPRIIVSMDAGPPGKVLLHDDGYSRDWSECLLPDELQQLLDLLQLASWRIRFGEVPPFNDFGKGI